jgi:hypothetical protein
LYEVDCPDCRHSFDVGEEDTLVRCPACGLELELVAPEGVDGGPTPLPDAPGGYTESPCPFCGGLLLVADSDEAGLCAHCERPLLFDGGRALVDVAGQEPDLSGASDAPRAGSPPASAAASANTIGFDPSLKVTSANAPLIEMGDGGPQAPVSESASPGAQAAAVAQTSSKPGGASGKKKATRGKKRGVSKKSSGKKPAKKGARKVAKNGGAKKAKKSASGGRSSKRASSGRKAGKKASKRAGRRKGA